MAPFPTRRPVPRKTLSDYVNQHPQTRKCGQVAAESLLRCHLSVKTFVVSILISGNQPFPRRSFPYGIIHHRAFSVKIAKCGQGAAKALLRCRFAAKSVTVSILMSENQPFPPRSFPYGIMNQTTLSDQQLRARRNGALRLQSPPVAAHLPPRRHPSPATTLSLPPPHRARPCFAPTALAR